MVEHMNIGKVLLPHCQPLAISPTDISQFVRLEQCERYLHLRLYERNIDSGFMQAYGVAPQSMPPLLTRSGEQFEAKIEAAIDGTRRQINLSQERGASQCDDNERIAALARDLSAGDICFVMQPRLSVIIDMTCSPKESSF